MSSDSLKCRQSFLSSEVNDLLRKALPACHSSEFALDAGAWVTKDFGIVWETLDEQFSGIGEIPESKAWFSEAVRRIAPLFSHCQDLVRSLSQDDYSVTIHPFLGWTHQESEVSVCLKQISGGSCDHLLALLIITAVTERALGNLVLTRRQQVPFLLRDLLVTPELQEILGKTRIQLLIILLGSVKGLNLRNIAWHGFLSHREANPAFVTTIVAILVDCGKLLKEHNETVDVPIRPLVSFREGSLLNKVFKEVSFPPISVIEELVHKSPLVPNIMVPVWMKALELFVSKCWGMSVVLLLTMLECSLRCLFAHVNGVSERVLTAENSSFYTTLDEILKPSVEEGNCDSYDIINKRTNNHRENTLSQDCPKILNTSCEQSEPHTGRTSNANKVLFLIGKKLNEALHDLLNFIQGPRVRDRVSHGEVRLEQIPQVITQHILYLCLLVLSLGNWRPSPGKVCDCRHDQSCINCDAENINYLFIEEGKTHQNYFAGCTSIDGEIKFDSFIIKGISEDLQYLIVVLSGCIENYKSIYHPSAILHDKLNSCVTQLNDWMTWERVDCSELDYDDWESRVSLELPKLISFLPLGITHNVVSLDNIREFHTHVSNMKFKVLYRSKIELEFVSVLHRIITNVQSSLDNIRENLSVKYSLYVSKRLRSRQRETYRRQLNTVPTAVLNCYLTSQAVYSLFFSINRIPQLGKSCSSNLLKVLKVVLKAHENIVSQTSLNVNRWEEAMAISKKNIAFIKENFSTQECIC